MKRKVTIFTGLNYALLILFGLLCVYPFYFIIINSISSIDEINKGVLFFPIEITFEYYSQIFAIPEIYNAIFISVARCVLGTVLTVACSTFLAFMVTKKELPFRKIIYRMVVGTMYCSAGLIPYYILMKNLRLLDNFLIYILPGTVSAFYVVLAKTYIESIPAEIEESALLDGAGLFKVFFQIIIPLSLPIIACLIVFASVGQWNAWADNLYYVTDKNLTTLQYLLYKYLSSASALVNITNLSNSVSSLQQHKITPMAIRLAMTVITVVPIMVVYPVMQKYFVKGIMLGAVKG